MALSTFAARIQELHTVDGGRSAIPDHLTTNPGSIMTKLKMASVQGAGRARIVNYGSTDDMALAAWNDPDGIVQLGIIDRRKWRAWSCPAHERDSVLELVQLAAHLVAQFSPPRSRQRPHHHRPVRYTRRIATAA